MNNTKTKLSVFCIISLICFSLALPSQAATVSELQATINALIAQVTALQAQLAILQSSTSSSLPLNCAGITFNRPLLQGSYGNDVKCLQTLLNRNTDTRIANSGPGSLGQETYYFGYLTKLAVIRLQNKYASEILTPSRLTYGTGIVGPSTRTKLNTICSSFTTTIPPVTTPATTTPTTTIQAATTTIKDITAPAAISTLYVSNITNNSIALSWTAPGDDGTVGTAASYDIRYSTSLINGSNWGSAASVSGEPAPLTSGTTQSYVFTGLSPDTAYYFVIKSVDESNNISPLSNIVSGKTLSSQTTDTTEPVRSGSSPSGTLTAGTTQATISLTTNESATCKYSTTAGTAYASMTGTFTTTGGTTHSKTITGLTNGTSYTYYVRCTDVAGNINTSDYTISFSVSSPSCNSCGLGNPLISPASPISNTSFTITCPANNTGYDCINAYANGSSNKCTFSSYSGNNAIFSCTGLTAGSYTSKCEAVTGTSRNCCAANMTGSYTVQAAPDTTAPSQITNLSSSNLAQNSVTLTWTAPGNDGTVGTATSYDIRYSTASITSSNWTSATAASGEPTPLISGTNQTFTVTGLSASTTYYFAIRSTDNSGNISAISNIVSGKTLTAIVSDTTPPTESNAQPSGTLTAGTTQATISLTTNESATCKYSTTAGTAYASMTGTFTTTGGTTHSKTITGLTNGTSYTYYIRCTDLAGNINTSDYTISFSVSYPSVTTGITLTSPNGGETWQRGTTHTITWNYTGSPGPYAKIALLKAGTEIGTIIASTTIGSSGTGSYVWDISADTSLTLGSDMAVSVQSISQSTVKDISNAYFTLTPACNICGLGTPVIAPTSPVSGNTFTITCPANASGYDCINAYANGSSNKCTFSSYSGNNAIFSCTGLTSGSYTSKCEAVTGTSRNCCAANATGSYTVAQTNSPVGYWKFDETSGTAVSDSSGNGNNGTTYGAVRVTGRVNNALQFDGANDYVNAGSGASLNISGELTIESWVKESAIGSYSKIASRRTGNSYYFLGSRGGFPYGGIGNGSIETFLIKDTAMPINEWHHLAFTFTDAGNSGCLYYDGRLSKCSTISYSIGSLSGVNLSIGADEQGTAYFFNGLIDEVKIYSRVLSATEILADYNAAGTVPADTTAPTRSNASPSGILAAGTTQATISLSTNESATCKYSTTAGTAYASMTGTFTATGGTTHSKTITGLTNGTSYTYYVRCTDSSNNVNTSDYTISFSVSPLAATCSSTALGVPTVTPTNPIANTSFTITCPANNTGYDCINAYANGSSNKCTFSSYSGNNAIFSCTGLTAGSYTSKCEAITGTSRNCCAANKTGSYSIQASVPTGSVNIADFGVTGDGTNEGPEIQAALDYAKNNGKSSVIFPTGKTIMNREKLNFWAGITVYGNGSTIKRIDYSGIPDTQTANVYGKVTGLKFDGGTSFATRDAACGVYLFSGAVFDNNEVFNFSAYMLSVFAGSGMHDIQITNNKVYNSKQYGICTGLGDPTGWSQNITVTGNTITNCQEVGIKIRGTANSTISNNTINITDSAQYSRGISLYSDDAGTSNITISNNTIVGNLGLGSGSCDGISSDTRNSNTGVTITNNNVRSCDGGIIIPNTSGTVTGNYISGCTTCISSAYRTGNTCATTAGVYITSYPFKYDGSNEISLLRTAIADAAANSSKTLIFPAGKTITVGTAGSNDASTAQIRFTSGLNVIGNGSTLFCANGVMPTTSGGSGTMWIYAEPGVNISGLTIDGNRYNNGSNVHGIMLQGNNIFNNNVVKRVWSYAVVVYGSTPTNVYITNNTITDSHQYGITTGCTDGPSCYGHNIVVTGNTITDCDQVGIKIRGTVGATIANNVITLGDHTGDEPAGIRLYTWDEKNQDIVIENNTITGLGENPSQCIKSDNPGEYGSVWGDNKNITIRGNNVSKCYDGITVQLGGATITNNTITNCTRSLTIVTQPGLSNIISGNTCNGGLC